jgi:transcriptional regulator with XRE-family HTH domain
MPRTLATPRHKALRELIIQKRKGRGLTQHALARALRRSQSYIASIETGQRRVDVVEFFELAEALRFDPIEALKAIKRTRAK